jgi:hypothetical protein
VARFDNHAEVFNFLSIEDIFLWFEEQFLPVNCFQYPSSAHLVFCKHFGKDKNIVHVDHKPSFINLLLECVVHVCLECSRGVAETKEHDIGFKQSKFHSECCLPLIIQVNLNVIISGSNIHFSEILCIM